MGFDQQMLIRFVFRSRGLVYKRTAAAANRHHCSFVLLNYETQLKRSKRKHVQAPLAATIQSISDLGAQLTASWNELY